MGLTIKQKYERADDWKERARTIDFYHKLRKLRFPTHGLKDTAAYFEVSLALVCEDIQLAENMDFVDVCNSRKTALAMLKEMPTARPAPKAKDNGN